MTVVVGYAAAESVILATDQMITWSREVRFKGKKRVQHRFSESTVKSTFYAGQYLLGFAGVANLGGETEKWLVDNLSTMADPIRYRQWREALCESVGKELRRLRPPDPWFAVMAVGYASDREAPTKPPRPLLQVISNSDNALRLRAGRARTDYDHFTQALPSVPVARDEFRLWAIGNVPGKSMLIEAADAITRYRKRHPGHSLEIASTLARVIVKRSDELGGRGVGSSVHVTVMPRAALGSRVISPGAFDDSVNLVSSIHYNPPLRTSTGVPVLTGANLVTPELSMYGMAMALGSIEWIGPREPFIEPSTSPGVPGGHRDQGGHLT